MAVEHLAEVELGDHHLGRIARPGERNRQLPSVAGVADDDLRLAGQRPEERDPLGDSRGRARVKQPRPRPGLSRVAMGADDREEPSATLRSRWPSGLSQRRGERRGRVHQRGLAPRARAAAVHDQFIDRDDVGPRLGTEGIPQRLGVRLDPVEDEVAVLAPRVLGGDAGRLDPTESIVLLADLLSGAAVRRPGGDPPKRGRDDRRGEVVLARVRVPLVWPEAVEALDAR